MYEAFTYTFTSPAIFDKLCLPDDSPLRNCVKIRNPLGEDSSIMRTTTLASMLTALSYNYNHKNPTAKLFEITKVYIPTEPGKLPNEPEKLVMGMYSNGMDFFDIKGVLEASFDSLNMKGLFFRQLIDNPSFHPGRTAEILAGDTVIGVVGEIHPDVLANFEIETPCYVAEIDLMGMFETVDADVKFTQLHKFPAAEQWFAAE